MTNIWIILAASVLTFLFSLFSGKERWELFSFLASAVIRTAAAFAILLKTGDLTAVLLLLTVSLLPELVVERIRLYRRKRSGAAEGKEKRT